MSVQNNVFPIEIWDSANLSARRIRESRIELLGQPANAFAKKGNKI
jgi:hypothetical protein